MKTLIFILLICGVSPVQSQSYQTEDIKIGLSRGKCYQAAISIDKSTIVDTDNRSNYYGHVSNLDPQAAFEIIAYPQGEQPAAHNRLSIVAFSRPGGHQEISMNYQGKSSVFYPDKINSQTTQYGFHFELGDQNGNVLQQLLLKELIKIDIIERACGNEPQSQPPVYYYPPPVQTNPNEGCEELHDAIDAISSKMYKWPDEDKGKAWSASQTRKIYDLPGGCLGRDKEVNKLFASAGSVYPKWNEDDERFAWFKARLDESFARPSNYLQDNLGDEIDDLLLEAEEIFPWNKKDEKKRWLTKKIKELLK